MPQRGRLNLNVFIQSKVCPAYCYFEPHCTEARLLGCLYNRLPNRRRFSVLALEFEFEDLRDITSSDGDLGRNASEPSDVVH